MSYSDRQKESGFKVGDKVRVTRIAEDYEDDWSNCWNSQMDGAVGNVFTIEEDRKELGFRLNFARYGFPYFILELVSEKACTTKSNDFPHICPRCGAPAYCGLQKVDCSKGCK
jgi:hypothetical protein